MNFFFVVKGQSIWDFESEGYVFPDEFQDIGNKNCCYRLDLDPFCELINADKEKLTCPFACGKGPCMFAPQVAKGHGATMLCNSSGGK